jgi:hypothetical protein
MQLGVAVPGILDAVHEVDARARSRRVFAHAEGDRAPPSSTGLIRLSRPTPQLPVL